MTSTVPGPAGAAPKRIFSKKSGELRRGKVQTKQIIAFLNIYEPF